MTRNQTPTKLNAHCMNNVIARNNPHTHSPVVADTGATAHFFEHQHSTMVHTTIPLTNITPTSQGITVLLPNQATMRSSHTGLLDLPQLPTRARQVHLFPKLASGSLLSIGQLCDAGCQATFDRQHLRIYHNNKLIMTGTRQPNKLWTIDDSTHHSLNSATHTDITHTNTLHSLNSAIDAPTTAERVAFYHKSLFSPTLSTLAKAIQAGYLTTFPTITTKQLRRWPPDQTATVKGHMHAKRANIQSTKQLANKVTLPTTSPIIQPKPFPTVTKPQPLPPNARTNHIYAACEPTSGTIYTDQTGHFTLPSSSGNKYLFICYDYDSNYINAIPMATKSQDQILKAYKTAIAMLQAKGLHPKLQRLDNEASQALINEIDHNNIDLQLTFKNHFIAGLCSVDPSFPLHLWDKLLPQAIITLNLLRPSRINPNLSAYAQLHGQFDFNRTPLAPPGTKVLAYIRPENRPSWAPHAREGFYVGPAMRHYCCHNVWTKSTGRTSIVDTLKWMPHNFRMPIANRKGLIVAAARDLTKAILSTDTDRLLPALDSDTRSQLHQLSKLFAKALPTEAQDTHFHMIPPRVHSRPLTNSRRPNATHVTHTSSHLPATNSQRQNH